MATVSIKITKACTLDTRTSYTAAPNPITAVVGTTYTVLDSVAAALSGDGVFAYSGISTAGQNVVIYGATPSGISAAIYAARAGANVILLESSANIGGMVTGGITHTDVDTSASSQSVVGFAEEFYKELAEKFYLKTYQEFYTLAFAANPNEALRVFRKYIAQANIALITSAQITKVNKTGLEITSIETTKGTFSGRAFIDASYEGDMLALAGLSYATGRESSAQYGEADAGVRTFSASRQFPDGVDPYVTAGVPSSGFLPGVFETFTSAVGDASPYGMAFTYRLYCSGAAGRIPFPDPTSYDALNYELLGRHFAVDSSGLTSLQNVVTFYFSGVETNTYDFNDGFSVGTNYMSPECQEYITATPARRLQIAANAKDWILGFFKFLKTDSRVPTAVKNDVSNYGLAPNGWNGNGNFPPCFYIRQSRRLIGDFIAKETDVTSVTAHTDPIAWSFYRLDSHHCRRVYVPGTGVKNEGLLSVARNNAPQPIPMRVIFPKAAECINLVSAFCVSSSYLAFCAYRMEPILMGIGSGAGVVAAMYASGKYAKIQDVTWGAMTRYHDPRVQIPPLGGAQISTDGTTYTQGTRTISGTWTTVAAKVAGSAGDDYRVSTQVGATITFAPNLARTGTYAVQIRYPVTANARSSIAPFTVNHAGGAASITIDQNNIATSDCAQWVTLGHYVCRKGSPSADTVVAATDGAGGGTIISAVRWVPLN